MCILIICIRTRLKNKNVFRIANACICFLVTHDRGYFQYQFWINRLSTKGDGFTLRQLINQRGPLPLYRRGNGLGVTSHSSTYPKCLSETFFSFRFYKDCIVYTCNSNFNLNQQLDVIETYTVKNNVCYCSDLTVLPYFGKKKIF